MPFVVPLPVILSLTLFLFVKLFTSTQSGHSFLDRSCDNRLEGEQASFTKHYFPIMPMFLQCKPVSGQDMLKRRSAPAFELPWLGKTFCFHLLSQR